MYGKYNRPLSNLQFSSQLPPTVKKTGVVPRIVKKISVEPRTVKKIGEERRFGNGLKELEELTEKYKKLEIEHEALKLSYVHLTDSKAVQDSELMISNNAIEDLKRINLESLKAIDDLKQENEQLK